MEEQLGTLSQDTPTSRRKPRVCPYCKRPFRRYEHLQRHLRIHTNEKPYKCDCGSSFSRQDLLKRHQSIGHAPIIPSTPDPSPTGVAEVSNVESRADSSYIGAGEPLTERIDSRNIPSAPVGRDGPLGNGHYEGNSLFSAQDLLVLQDLEMFCNNLGPNNEWYLPSDPSIVQIFAGDTHSNSSALPPPSIIHLPVEHPPISEQVLSKLPTEREAVAEFGVLTFPILTVTSQQRERLLQALMQCHSSEASSSLPSCHSLTRFINGFLDGFYPHMPVVHMPTFRISDGAPEVLLAMCALGAQYRHENRKAAILFHAARDLLQHKSRNGDWLVPDNISRTADQQVYTPSHHTLQYRQTMDEARCAFLLIAFAAWQCDEAIAREAFNLQSFLARCIRECGLEETDQPSNVTTDWHSWIQQETDRRVKLFSFAFLNLQFIAFGTPPAILADEINLRLPCSCLEWISPDEHKWGLVRRSGHREQMLFQDALCHVMKFPQEASADTPAVPSPLANYILIHALIQRVLLAYHVIGPYNHLTNDSLKGQKEIMRNALHAWTSLWQRAPESSLDPRNPNGPVPFTSTALLGVAYIRLSFNLGSYKLLRTRNKEEIAARLLRIPQLPPGPHLLPAALHATHALSIPVKLGVNFVARSHAFVWSVQHSLCGLEFSIFLSKWLFCLADCQTRRSLDEHEARLVSWISDIVEEGRASGDDDFWPRPSNPSECAYLGFAVVKLWARLIRGNEQWSLLGVIGDALDMYADTWERDFMSSQTVVSGSV
ncbi:hypothetical protein BJX68DRAFT_226222 [Aspergillus pseudodeflectus]|uniref:C2H2-type domain-containing protein n=1 Tax=Aspergillus pseudodeflectus TaxID=176178 RepID=A0ABR4L5H8_9EURO